MSNSDLSELVIFVCAVVGALVIIGWTIRVAVGLMMWLVDKLTGHIQ